MGFGVKNHSPLPKSTHGGRRHAGPLAASPTCAPRTVRPLAGHPPQDSPCPCTQGPWSPGDSEATTSKGGDSSPASSLELLLRHQPCVVRQTARSGTHRGNGPDNMKATAKPKSGGLFLSCSRLAAKAQRRKGHPRRIPGVGQVSLALCLCLLLRPPRPLLGNRESGSGRSQTVLALPSPQGKLISRQIFRMGNCYLN